MFGRIDPLQMLLMPIYMNSEILLSWPQSFSWSMFQSVTFLNCSTKVSVILPQMTISPLLMSFCSASVRRLNFYMFWKRCSGGHQRVSLSWGRRLMKASVQAVDVTWLMWRRYQKCLYQVSDIVGNIMNDISCSYLNCIFSSSFIKFPLS